MPQEPVKPETEGDSEEGPRCRMCGRGGAQEAKISADQIEFEHPVRVQAPFNVMAGTLRAMACWRAAQERAGARDGNLPPSQGGLGFPRPDRGGPNFAVMQMCRTSWRGQVMPATCTCGAYFLEADVELAPAVLEKMRTKDG